MRKWPNLFIVGTPKAGTSSLYAYLSKIPGIYMSPVKEPNYFSSKTIPEQSRIKPIRDRTKYLSLFKKVKNEKIFGEASTSYLSDPDAAKLIHDVSPDARIIISLRDPVERTLSYYFMLLRNGLMKGSFHEEVQKSLKVVGVYNTRSLNLEAGLYSGDVQRYLNIFGPTHVKILIFEEFVKEPKKIMKEVLSFLGIDIELNDFKDEIYNKYGVPRGTISQFLLKSFKVKRIAEKIIPTSSRRVIKEKFLLKNEQKPKMSEIDRDVLTKFYREDVKKLEKILGRKLPWKNFQS